LYNKIILIFIINTIYYNLKLKGLIVKKLIIFSCLTSSLLLATPADDFAIMQNGILNGKALIYKEDSIASALIDYLTNSAHLPSDVPTTDTTIKTKIQTILPSFSFINPISKAAITITYAAGDYSFTSNINTTTSPTYIVDMYTDNNKRNSTSFRSGSIAAIKLPVALKKKLAIFTNDANSMVVENLTDCTNTAKNCYVVTSGGYDKYVYSASQTSWINKSNITPVFAADLATLNAIVGIIGQIGYVKVGVTATQYIYNGAVWLEIK
jgi:hypothetical protein